MTHLNQLKNSAIQQNFVNDTAQARIIVGDVDSF